MRAILIAALACGHLALFAQSPKLTRSGVEAMMKELSNWGRWGKDDQLGTIHLIQ